MSQINGGLSPCLVITYMDGTTKTETVTPTNFTSFEESYDPQFLTHEIDDNTVRRRLDGFWYHATLTYDYVDASELVKYSRIAHGITRTDGQGGVVTTGYTSIKLYPYYSTKPYYYINVTLDDDSIGLMTFAKISQKDFSLKFRSTTLLDYVPLTPDEFLRWGNITLRFSDLATDEFNHYT